MVTILFCTISFVNSPDNGASLLSYRSNIDILRLIISLVVFMVGMTLSGGIFSLKENKILQNNYVCDYDKQVIRPRTPEETEQIFAIIGLSSMPDTSSEKQSKATDASGSQTIKALSEEARIKLLKEYKALLDAGIISKEEYEAKKHELLH